MLRRVGPASLLPWLLACAGPKSLPCEENDTSTEELPRVSLGIGEQEISAEVADDEDERASAWVGRVCDLEALLWVPDAVEPAAVTLCGVEALVDLVFVREGVVLSVQADVPPCDDACEECPQYGQSLPAVDAVLWLPAGAVDVAVGDEITGLDAVMLPSAM